MDQSKFGGFVDTIPLPRRSRRPKVAHTGFPDGLEKRREGEDGFKPTVDARAQPPVHDDPACYEHARPGGFQRGTRFSRPLGPSPRTPRQGESGLVDDGWKSSGPARQKVVTYARRLVTPAAGLRAGLRMPRLSSIRKTQSNTDTDIRQTDILHNGSPPAGLTPPPARGRSRGWFRHGPRGRPGTTPDRTRHRLRGFKSHRPHQQKEERMVVIDFRSYETVIRRRGFQPPWVYLHVYTCKCCGRKHHVNFHGGVPPGGFACDCEEKETCRK